MRKTDFFIVGAPKCGTTALAVYLNNRADVFLSAPKEPHYFATDFPRYRAVQDEDEYLRLFEKATAEQLLGEASVFNLYSRNALALIREFNERAKIVVMLRNPIELVYSLHSQLLFTHDENVKDFSKAWSLCDERRRGKKIPARCRESKLLFYDELADFGDQLERLFESFPREQVHVVLFQDFVSNTADEFQRVVQFLDLPDEYRSDFHRVNRNRRHRSELLSDLLFHRSKLLRGPVKRIKNFLNIERFGLLAPLRRLETRHEERSPLDDDIRSEIVANYAEATRYVERLLNRSLGHWQ